jgi:hypothetical protein
MPSDVLENVHFETSIRTLPICLSTYQCQLNLVYKVASPLLEDIYGLRTSYNAGVFSELPKQVVTVYQALQEWHSNLPQHLSYELLNDLTPNSSAEAKAHSLQALSLELTYHNIIIVIHRPLLAGPASMEQVTVPESVTPRSQFLDNIRETSFKRCLDSALRISNLQQKPKLLALSQKTHLVSFLGMNLFTASVVLFLCALSDTLSDTAQEAKRGLKRTLGMQKALSNDTSLSLQCSSILEDLVQLILKKELEEMLNDHTPNAQNPPAGPETHEGVYNDERIQHEEMDSDVPVPETASNTYGNMMDSSQHGGLSSFTQSLMTLQRGRYTYQNNDLNVVLIES